MSDLIGKEKLDAKLKRLQDPRLLNVSLMAAALTLQNKLAPYPASTSANRPGRVDKRGKPMGYYERGRGWWYPVLRKSSMPMYKGNRGISKGAITNKQAVKRYGVNTGLNSLGAFAVSQVAGYKLSRSNQSQTLNRRWTVYSKSANVVVLANNATYARYLHDKKKQAKIAARREWKAYQDVWAEHGKAIMDKARLEYARVIRGG